MQSTIDSLPGYRRIVQMNKWLKRARGALGMGVTWAVAWAIAGLLIGASSLLLPFLPWHYFFDVFDAPLPALAIPGFFGGIFFSIVLGVAGRDRPFSDLSPTRFAAWGALGGVMLSLFPAALVAAGLATPAGGTIWPFVAAISIPCVLLSTASAAITLRVARSAERRTALGTGQDHERLEA